MGKQGTRRNKSKPRAKQRRQLPSLPTSVHDLPDELLDRVLLGLGSPLDLIRAAATCRRWRRAIADESFLGRSHDLHGAPRVAGHYYPHLCPRRRPAVADAGRPFSLVFLPVPPAEADRPRRTYYYYSSPRRSRIRHNRCREIIDSRGSLLLLTNEPWREHIDRRRWSPDFIVCEPVSQRYQGILRPVDLSDLPMLGAFLLDGGGRGGNTMSNFRVLSVFYEHDRPRYQFGTPRARSIHLAGRSGGRVYWGIEDGTMLVLDESTLRFSVLTFPAQMQGTYRRTSFRVIGGAVAGEDGVRVVRVHGEDLEVFGQLPDSGEWVMEKSVGLRDAMARLPGWDWDCQFRCFPVRIVTAGNTFVVLTPAEKTWLFSLELETMEVEQEHERNRHVGTSYPCALPWPPVLRACVHRGCNAAGADGAMLRRPRYTVLRLRCCPAGCCDRTQSVNLEVYARAAAGAFWS
ncbi:hypothetical protein HU200_014002 [Digitaria exilis]|uniref:F-box domain-containing protein n=1 Tax=Digitaria exilis TaxID=1010633 RepID=A0A835FBU6_9POAL|nr:hypothetical protein HU200_014002 [Digitaria exilis]